MVADNSMRNSCAGLLLLTFVVPAALPPIVLCADEASPDAPAVLAAYEASCALIDSYDVVLSVKEFRYLDVSFVESERGRTSVYTPRSPADRAATVNVLHGRQWRSENRSRQELYESKGAVYEPGQFLDVCDAHELRRMNVSTMRGRRDPGTLTTSVVGDYLPPYDVLFLRGLNQPYGEMIRARPFTVSRSETSVVVDAPPAPERAINANSYGVRLTLDPNAAYMPATVSWYRIRDQQEIVLNRIHNELEQVAPGVWVPMSSRITFLCANAEAKEFGQVLNEYVVTLDRERARFNVPVDDNLFQLQFPVGMTVVDHVRDLKYVVGEETEEATLVSLATQGRLGTDRLQAAMSGDQSLEARQGVPVTVLLAINILLFCAVAVGLWYRSRKERRP